MATSVDPLFISLDLKKSCAQCTSMYNCSEIQRYQNIINQGGHPMGPVRLRHIYIYSSHDFGWQSSHSVHLTGWQAKMAAIEIWIPWRNAHKPHCTGFHSHHVMGKESVAGRGRMVIVADYEHFESLAWPGEVASLTSQTLTCAIFSLSAWPSSRTIFDLGPSPFGSTEEISLRSELMILECSFPLTY